MSIEVVEGAKRFNALDWAGMLLIAFVIGIAVSTSIAKLAGAMFAALLIQIGYLSHRRMNP